MALGGPMNLANGLYASGDFFRVLGVPAILGHEVAGEVIAVGPGVTTWKIGDRAAWTPHLKNGIDAAVHAAVVTVLHEIYRAHSARNPSPFSTPLIANR